MNPTEFQTILRQTLDDHKLSRGERRALSEVLEDLSPPESMLGVYRKTAFDLAREELDGALKPEEILHWLEDVVKVLQTRTDDGSPGAKPEAYFSPGTSCRNRISSLLKGSRNTVEVCVFTITDDVITEAIMDAHHRGVQVRIVSDDDKSEDRGSDMHIFERAGIPVRLDQTRHHMHHKFAIFDSDLLLTGSYNWTRGAAKYNEENIVVLAERPLIAQFQQQFEEMWELFG